MYSLVHYGLLYTTKVENKAYYLPDDKHLVYERLGDQTPVYIYIFFLM